MAKLSKRMKELKGGIDPQRSYPLKEAVSAVKAGGKTKFDESVDIAIRLGVDPRNALSRGVHGAESVLGTSIAVLGCQPVTLGRLGVVLRDTLALVVHDAEFVLGIGIALRGQRPPQPQCRHVVTAFSGFHHSRSSFSASAICVGVMLAATASRPCTAKSRSSSSGKRDAARLNHMCACT